MKKIIQTSSAPAPIGPYNQAVLVDNTLYVSGQIAIDPVSGHMIQDNLVIETKQALENARAILQAADMDFSNVVKATIFILDMANFVTINEVYATYFKSDFPARETVAVAGLPKGANVEISFIAVK